MATGWTFPVVEQLTVQQLDDLQAHWQTCPPLNVLVASYLGVYKPKSATKEKATPQQLRELAAAFGMAIKEG